MVSRPVRHFRLIHAQIGGILIQKKRYGPLDFLASTLLCLGLVVFTLADATLGATYDPIGTVTRLEFKAADFERHSFYIMCIVRGCSHRQRARKGHEGSWWHQH